jgi:hypothetical protein
MSVDYIKLLKDNLKDFGEWTERENSFTQCTLIKLGSRNYFNEIFYPAKDEEKIKKEIEETETYLEKKLSDEFRDFLKQTDGFLAYSGSLKIYGLGISAFNWCIIPNNPKFLFKDTLNKIYPSFYVIGFFCVNLICLSSEKKGVFIVDKETWTILMEFDSLYACIEYALKFLRPCYDDEGYIYPEYPTLIRNHMKTKKIC